MRIYSNRESLLLVKSQLEKALSNDPKLYALQYDLNDLNRFEPFNVDENYIRYQTYSIISYHSGYKIPEINDNKHLKFDLGLSIQRDKLLVCKKLNILIKELGGTKFITIDECKKLEFVGDCIKLTISKLK